MRQVVTGSTDVGALVTFHVTLEDGRVLAPVRGVTAGMETVRSLIGHKVNPDLPFLTFRHEGATVMLTLRDLKLAP